LRSSLSVCILTSSDLAQTLTAYLSDVLSADASFRYKVNQFDTNAELLLFIQTNHHIDCLILQEHSQLQDLLNQLQQQALFFPTVILQTSKPAATVSGKELLIANSHFSYHGAVLYFLPQSLNQIGLWIDQAISKFIQLTPSSESLSSTGSPPVMKRC
jgi:circadian clock protein KaiA